MTETSADSKAIAPVPKGLFKGLGYAIRGVPYTFKRPQLLRLAIVPLLVNVVLLALLVSLGLYFFDSLWGLVFPWEEPEGWFMAALWWIGFVLLRVLLYLVGAVVCFLFVVALGSIIAAPFHDALSERTEQTLRGSTSEAPFSLKNAVAEILATLRDQVALLSIYLAGLVIILLLNLVPIIGSIISAILSYFWTCWFLTLEFTEPPLARAKLRWRERWEFLMGHFRLTVGFGVGSWLLLFVPLTMPFLFVAGTLLVCDLRPKPAENRS